MRRCSKTRIKAFCSLLSAPEPTVFPNPVNVYWDPVQCSSQCSEAPPDCQDRKQTKKSPCRCQRWLPELRHFGFCRGSRWTHGSNDVQTFLNGFLKLSYIQSHKRYCMFLVHLFYVNTCRLMETERLLLIFSLCYRGSSLHLTV